MPTIILPRTNSIQVSPRFAVVGMYDRPDSVRHVGVLQEDARLVYDELAKVAHMGPPLNLNDSIPAHLVSWLGDLSRDERDSLEAWLSHIQTLSRVRFDYHVNPPYEDIHDPVSGVMIRRRMNCCGFVMLCYREALQLDLLDRTIDSLPLIDLTTLQECYPDLGLSRRLLARLGLQGDGPWAVVMPGYLLHAFHRADHQIRQQPYLPRGTDIRFPGAD